MEFSICQQKNENELKRGHELKRGQARSAKINYIRVFTAITVLKTEGRTHNSTGPLFTRMVVWNFRSVNKKMKTS